MKKILSIIITLILVFSVVSPLGFNVKAESKIETPKPVIETPDPVMGISSEDIYKSSDIENNRKGIEPSLLRDDPLAETFTPKSDDSSPALAEGRKESFTPLPDIDYVSDDSSETMLSKRDDSIDSDKDFEPGVVLVGLKSSSTKLSPKEMFSELDIVKAEDQDELLYEAVSVSSSVKKSRIEELKKETGTNYILKLANKNKKSVLEAIEILKQDPDVEYAIPNYAIEPCVTPNDFNNYDLWGMTRIQAPQAWDSYTGGAAVNVGIIDSGIDNNHPDLKDNVNMALAYDAQNKNSINTMDYNSHGTHVAGTVGAKGNNTIGVVGVNWNVRLVPIKIVIDNSGAGFAYITAMVEAVRYAIRNNIPICNMSYGTPDYAPFIDAIRDYNGLFVIAAGNDAENIDNSNAYTKLNSLGNVLFVASSNNATGENEALSGFSNYGIKNAHISAPGENIISTVPGGGYSSKSGTSMATPHVAGVAALIKGRYPALTTAQLKEAILTGADPAPKIAGLVSTGKLNAYSAVNRSSNPSYLVFQPNNNETMKAAITRCLGTKSASSIKSIKILGSAIMAPGRSGADSASAVLPNLVNVDISSFTGEINELAFYNCTNLTTAIFPLSDFSLPAYCFMYCSKLKTIYRANNFTRTLGEADFTGMLGVDKSNFPFAVQTQGFQGCTSLTTIRMPNTTKLRFSQYVFTNCSSLATVYLDTHPKVTGEIDLTEFVEIPSLVFKGTGMTSLKLPKDVEISNEAFQNCTNLKSIQIHPSQTATVTVGSQAFYNVNSACEVFINQGLYNMPSFIFPRSETVNIPKRINSLVVWPITNEKMADAIRWYLGSTAATSIKHLSLIGSVAMGDTSESESASILPNLETVDLSSFTGTLGSDSFYNCTKLKTVTSNTSFTYVPAACFMYCSSLNTIFVGDKYPKIWGEADLTNLSGGIATNTQSFESCTSLTTLRIPSTQIGIAGSFYNCTRLSTIYKSGNTKSFGVFDLTGISTFWSGWGHNFVGASVSTVKLPKNIDISEKCFFNCLNLNRIELDSSQTTAVKIGSQAFYNVRSTCEAFMHSTLVNNSSFQLPRTATMNILKKNY